MPLNLIFIAPGNYSLEDNGIPGDNISVIKDGNGTVIFTFAHPADALGFTVSTPGVNIAVNITDSLGAANFTIGNLASSAESPDAITVKHVNTTGSVTLVANGSITEGGSDAATDITAGSVVFSAGTAVGTGANAIETRTGLIEAETTTGGISVSNFGSVQIGGVAADVDGLDVATSGNISFTTLGSIFLTEANSVTATEVVHGGSTSGNITLTAIGANADIIGNVDNAAASASRGSVIFSAGRDIQLGTIGSDFNNDVIANNAVNFSAGRDILIDGFADVLSDNFGFNTGANLALSAGRNIGILNFAGTSASVTASGSGGGNAIITTGAGGSLTINGPGSFALGSTSGDVIVNTDRLLINAASGISAPNGEVFLRPVTHGWEIDLGSVTDAALALELSDVEVDRIFAPTLTIGSGSSGPIYAIGAFGPANIQNLTLISGTDIVLSSALTVAQILTLRAGDDVFLTAGSATTAGSLSVFVDQQGDDGSLGGSTTFAGALTAGTPTITGDVDADTLNGTSGSDKISGAGGNDTLIGAGGNDTLDGGVGADLIVGGQGNDKLIDSAGGDTLEGGADDDLYLAFGTGTTIVEGVGEGTDVIRAKANVAMADNVENLTMLGGQNLTATGNGLDNDMTGNSGANKLVGLAGNDFLAGRAGADTLEGRAGNDTLRGDRGADSLDGGTGVDVLFGDGGLDTLTGGTGADTFTFLDDSQFDTITDFEDGIDRIRLSDYREENGGTKLTINQLLITQVGANTRIQIDIDMNGIADSIDLDGDGSNDGWSVTLLNTNAATITAADFVF